VSDLVCSTPGCNGDGRYAAPGRGHIETCHYPIVPTPTSDAVIVIDNGKTKITYEVEQDDARFVQRLLDKMVDKGLLNEGKIEP